MLLLAAGKEWYVAGIIALVAVLALYKYISARYIDKPSEQADQIDMLSKRLNHLENQVTRLSHQLDEHLNEPMSSDQNNNKP